MKRQQLIVLGFMAAALSLGPRPAAALEISLEENRAERGNIGFVDVREVFRRYPEARKAKQSYAEIVRQAEDQVNLKKAEMLSLRSELVRLKEERRKAREAPLPSVPPVPEPPKPAPIEIQPLSGGHATQVPLEVIESTAPAGLAPAATAQQTPAPEILGLPGMGSSTPEAPQPEAPAEDPVVIDIPGLSEEPIVVGASTAAAAIELVPTIGVSEEAKLAYELAVHERDLALKVRDSAVLAKAARLKEVEELILATEAELKARESGLGGHQASLEKNLIDIENRRAEILLGKIYRAIRVVARENGVSVVVDKAQILFGQESVDLTGKVIQKLEAQ